MSSETLVAERHRVFRPGDVCPPVTFTDGERSGYVMHDGDCPYSDSDVIDLCYDDGLPDSSSVCGFGDGDRMCCAPASTPAGSAVCARSTITWRTPATRPRCAPGTPRWSGVGLS